VPVGAAAYEFAVCGSQSVEDGIVELIGGVLKMLKIIAFGMHFSNNIVIILKYAFLLKSLL